MQDRNERPSKAKAGVRQDDHTPTFSEAVTGQVGAIQGDEGFHKLKSDLVSARDALRVARAEVESAAAALEAALEARSDKP